MTRIALLMLQSRGPAVQALQEKLNDQLDIRPPLVTDGVFGAKTQAAVRQLQSRHGLSPDGVAGPQTMTVLEHPDVLRWMTIAQREIGQKEIKGPRDNPRIVQYLHTTTNIAVRYREQDETPWCSAFVNWVLRRAGFVGTNHALAKSWLAWGFGVPPMFGAIAVIRKIGASKDAATGSSTGYHVGFCIRKTATHIQLLGGNQRNQVKHSNYPIGSYRIEGCRWPTHVGVPMSTGTSSVAYA